jgi:O-antigen/teichoic acid export membrane protein
MSISRNATYNVMGAALPSLLTLVTVPLYLHVVGVERYGILALCWIFLGYSGFMDLGLGLAVAHKMASVGDPEDPSAGDAFWAAMWMSLFTGLVGAVILYSGASLYFGRVARVAASFRGEVAAATPFIAAIVPTVMLSSVLNGVLQGRERFLHLNAAGALGQTAVAILPLLTASLWAPTLSALLGGAVAARLLPLPWLYSLCRKAVSLGRPRRPSAGTMRALLSFGGWVSLTTVANGILASADRLAIGSRIGAAAVPAYSIPYSLVSRIVIIPHSLAPALFPRFASLNAAERARLISHSIEAVAAMVTPISLALVIIAEPFFTLWIGPALARVSAPIAYALAGGFWVYCIGFPATALLQAAGRPHTVAKVYLAQLIPYGIAMVVAISAFGSMGAAMVVSVRAILESITFLFLARVPMAAIKILTVPAVLMLCAIAFAAGLPNPFRYPVLLLLFVGSGIWSFIHAPEALRPHLDRLAKAFNRVRNR